MQNLAVQAVRFVDEHQPGWVECEFRDAEGRTHKIIDKIPVLGLEDIWKDSSYPQPGMARCEVLDRWKDATGRELARITTDRPDGLESTDGLTEFVVVSEQLS
jgi:hypothetical protein